MTRVEIRKGPGEVGICMEGHAGCGRPGEDPVCAALSMLAYTMAQTMSRLEAQRKLLHPPVLHLGNGFARLEAKARPGNEAELRHCLEVIEGGFRLLADSFPQAVELRSIQYGTQF